MPPVSESRIAITTTMVEASPSLARMKALTPAESAAIRRRLVVFVKQFPSQSEAAQTIGVSQQSVNNVLRGSDPGLYVAKRIAAALGLSFEQAIAPWGGVLDEVVARHPKRWAEHTIVAVRSMPRAETLAEDVLEQLLDRVDSALAPFRREIQKLTK